MSIKDFLYFDELRFVGDMFIFMINGFGMGQWYFGSVYDGLIFGLVLISYKF